MALYLGIDAGTQSIKAELIDTVLGTIVSSCAVNFGEELPHYNSPNGFLPNDNPEVRQANPLMWLEALDIVLAKLQATGAELDKVAGISGSGQQHGSVYCNSSFESAIGSLDKKSSLKEQLKGSLSRSVSPIWMDHSTTLECQELDAKFGKELRTTTGSPAIERFTASQIRRFAKTDQQSYAETKTVHLVSSFLASVLIGKNAPIDFGDGAGMNLLNLKTLEWDSEIVEFTAPNLSEKLPSVVDSSTVAGGLSTYFEKYGFKVGTPVVVFSGDNPNSLIGTGASEPGVAVISLGTSDTFFAAMTNFITDPAGCGHLFGNPAGGFMSLICFVNGSLAREKVKEMCQVDWNYFDNIATQESVVGNNGKLMLPYFEAECTPSVSTTGAIYNFDVNSATPAELIRAVLESQALSLRAHSKWIGEEFTRIRVTGGASESLAFRQILADVFQATIESIQVVNSAALGAAIRAAVGADGLEFATLYSQFCSSSSLVQPNPENRELYAQKLTAFISFETQ